MFDLCLFCKSHRQDLERLVLLLDSVDQFNQDNLPVVLTVPKSDYLFFSNHLGKDRVAALILDEDLTGAPSPPGWRGQQVVKLHLARAGITRVAVMLDSDFAFIRPFSASDFLAPDGSPFLVASRIFHGYQPGNPALAAHILGTSTLPFVEADACNHFRSNSPPRRLPAFQRFRDRLTKPDRDTRLKRIHRLFGHPDPHLHFMPGPVWSTRTLERMTEDWLIPEGITFTQLILCSPFEYHWVAEYSLATGCQPIHPIDPFFLHFPTAEAVEDASKRGITLEHIKKRYLGIAMASRHHAFLKYPA